jgi:GTP-binding protein
MPPIIAIAGRPNVGKSTLFNRLSRSKSALVDDRPGITRDRIQAPISYNGKPIILLDTGGFEDIGQDPLLKEVRAQVRKAVEDADRVIFVVDGRQGLLPGDEEMALYLRKNQKKVFLAVNKVDSPEHDHLILEFHGLGMGTPFPISSAHGYGIAPFMEAVIEDMPITTHEHEDPDQVRIAVLGRPNAGKSSLINRILKQDRLVVSDIAGTTRDTVDSVFHHGRKEYVLIDTAGLRRKAKVKEKIDTFSMIKAVKSLDRCHVAVVLIDAWEGVSEQDARICGYALKKGRGLVLAINKWDLLKGEERKRRDLENDIDRQLHFISYAPRVNLSALTGERVIKLFTKIDMVFKEFSTRVTTGPLNRALQETTQRHPPPRIGGRGRLKFLYATQTGTRPPTFAIFVNRPDKVHFSYERLLINQFRSTFQLSHVPIKLDFKERKNKNKSKGSPNS